MLPPKAAALTEKANILPASNAAGRDLFAAAPLSPQPPQGQILGALTPRRSAPCHSCALQELSPCPLLQLEAWSETQGAGAAWAEVSREAAAGGARSRSGSPQAQHHSGGGRGAAGQGHITWGPAGERHGRQAHAEGAAVAPLGIHNTLSSAPLLKRSSGRVSCPIGWNFRFSKRFDGAERKMPPSPSCAAASVSTTLGCAVGPGKPSPLGGLLREPPKEFPSLITSGWMLSCQGLIIFRKV